MILISKKKIEQRNARVFVRVVLRLFDGIAKKKRLQPLGHQKINNWKYLLNPYREYCLAIQKLQRKSTICFQAYKSSIKKGYCFQLIYLCLV